MTETEYRALPSEEYFSYSFLKHFDDLGPKQLIEPKEYNNSGINFGQIVHTLALSPHEFEDNYYISKVEKDLTGTELKLYNAIIDDNDITEEFVASENFTTISLQYILDLKLWGNIKKEELLLAKIDDNFKNHVLESSVSEGKIIVSPTDYLDSINTYNVLKEHDFTSKYFKNTDLKKRQVLFEIPILYKIGDDNFKSLIDIIFVDHESKTIRAVDLKTGSKTNRYFKYEFITRRYDIQAFLYTKALETYRESNGLSEYTIINPLYIYTCRSTPNQPLPFEITLDVLRSAYTGYTTYTGREVSGIVDLVKDIKWHRKNEVYDYSKSEFQNKQSEIDDYDLGIRNRSNEFPRGILLREGNRPEEELTGLQPVEIPIGFSDLHDGLYKQMSEAYERSVVKNEPDVIEKWDAPKESNW